MTTTTQIPNRAESLLESARRTHSADATRPLERALEHLQRRWGDASAVERGVAVGEILAHLRLDPRALAAGVLHDLVARGEFEPSWVAEEIDPEVAMLTEGVKRLDAIRWDHLEEEEAESLRKMFLAMASDVRVVLIALGARLETMRRLDGQPQEERKRLARESLEVYAPLANRLGVWQIKWEIEDLAFRELETETYREIKEYLAQKRAARTESIERTMARLQAELDAAGIEAKVVGRPKHIYSIYKKMRRKGVDFDRIYDVNAVRIIVQEVADCYAVLGLVHGLWTPIAGEFDDYIAKPKENFYRSLHTAVIDEDGKPLEIQIRTQEMHEYNEFGIAAHWRYKEAKRADRRFDEKINWLRQLMEWQKEVTDPHELAESLKTDIFEDQVYVFTPTGQIVDLPQGSTPIDFAYRIHTEVGHRCRGAKVDGQIVPLDYRLKTGQRVEIITAKTGGPSRDWLNPHLGQVRTSGARQKIRQYFRQQGREQALAQGRELVDREIKRLGIEGKRPEDVAAFYPKHATPDDFLVAVGFGDISAQSIASRLLEAERKDAPPELPAVTTPTPVTKGAASVSIAGVDDVMSHPARCCNPVPGDEVVGFITRGRGVTIHRADCPNARNPSEPDRWMPLSWGVRPGHVYPVQIRVAAHDRKGLLRDIADLVATEGINLTSTSARTEENEGTAIIDTTLQISNAEQLVRILAKIERLPFVLTARRLG